jgi:hypothetical protein
MGKIVGRVIDLLPGDFMADPAVQAAEEIAAELQQVLS